jgi:hypothetical protein
MNPHLSPWNKPQPQIVQDKKLYWRWAPIKRHLARPVGISEYQGILTIGKDIYIAKNSSKFRIRSHLDWAWYTPKTLAQAIDNNTVDQYYEIMLTDVRSDPNVWKDSDFELELKSFYAARVGRASLI